MKRNFHVSPMSIRPSLREKQTCQQRLQPPVPMLRHISGGFDAHYPSAAPPSWAQSGATAALSLDGGTPTTVNVATPRTSPSGDQKRPGGESGLGFFRASLLRICPCQAPAQRPGDEVGHSASTYPSTDWHHQLLYLGVVSPPATRSFNDFKMLTPHYLLRSLPNSRSTSGYLRTTCSKA